jgi:hypothetical protein
MMPKSISHFLETTPLKNFFLFYKI